VLSVSRSGADLLHHRRSVRTDQFARALAENFSPDELATLDAAAKLLERLAENLNTDPEGRARRP